MAMSLKQYADEAAASEENKVEPFVKINDGDNVVSILTEGVYYVDDRFSTPEKEVSGFQFQAIDETGREGVLSVTSKRLLMALSKFDQLAGVTFVITRSGTGYDTQYSVVQKGKEESNPVLDAVASEEKFF